MNLVGRLTASVSRSVLYATTLLVIIAYFLGIYLLAKAGLIDRGEFIEDITIFVGWIFTLLLAVIHFRETQKDNQTARKEEVRKSLEVDAFRKVNEAVTQFSEIITELTTPYRTLPVSLRTYPTELALSTLREFINVRLPQQTISLWNGVSIFVLAIELNEIAVIKYDHLRKFIQFRVDDAREAINNFQRYAYSVNVESLFSETGLERLEKDCKTVEEALFNVTMYLFDYRIELMNHLLGDVFENGVPRRKPLDSSFKTLVELATKEKVEEEEKRRNVRVVGKE